MKMTKQELLVQIENRVTPEEYEPRDIGQGFGYKIDFDYLKEDFDENLVVYIPEHGYDNEGVPTEEGIYSFKDFLDICGGDREKALDLLDGVDWQYPETLYMEWEMYND